MYILTKKGLFLWNPISQNPTRVIFKSNGILKKCRIPILKNAEIKKKSLISNKVGDCGRYH